VIGRFASWTASPRFHPKSLARIEMRAFLRASFGALLPAT
jgi:hypothetical protein